MKKNILQCLAIIILLSIFILLLMGISFSISTTSKPIDSIIMTTMSIEEMQKPVLTNNIKIKFNFKDKLSMVQVHCNKELDTTEPLDEITIDPLEESTTILIEKETTNKNTENDTTFVVTTTEIISNQVLETTTTEKEITTEKVYYSGEYEAASIIWAYLKNLGYNNYVCAGIMGNIMSECGGHTLNIQWWLYGDNYYGICQWYCPYAPGIEGSDLDYQLYYLSSTIRSEINNFGYKYYNGFDYSSFLNLTNIEDTAIAFAACYERCASWTYSSRVNNAYKAYNYFCGQ